MSTDNWLCGYWIRYQWPRKKAKSCWMSHWSRKDLIFLPGLVSCFTATLSPCVNSPSSFCLQYFQFFNYTEHNGFEIFAREALHDVITSFPYDIFYPYCSTQSPPCVDSLFNFCLQYLQFFNYTKHNCILIFAREALHDGMTSFPNVWYFVHTVELKMVGCLIGGTFFPPRFVGCNKLIKH